MIIKIKIEDTLAIGGVAARPGGWWIEDGIAKVHIIQITIPANSPPSVDDVDCYLPYPESYPKAENEDRAIQLICRMKDGTERTIVFQGRGYLLNDEGKTIERLVS